MYIQWLKHIGISDINSVGGKNASLGEMFRNLSDKDICVPNAFVITTSAFYYYLQYNNLDKIINTLISEIDTSDLSVLRKVGFTIRSVIQNGQIPLDLEKLIREAYIDLSAQYKALELDVAVRSSATAEDLPDASFAGQQETYLNVRGPDKILESIKKCFASLYTDRAISYRKNIKYADLKLGMSVCIQKMVRSDLGSSGVAFSLDTETGFKDVILINGSWGLGEHIVQGSVKPDEIILFKSTLIKGFRAIIDKKLGDKLTKMIYSNRDQSTEIVDVEPEYVDRICLEDDVALKLGRMVMTIESHYSEIYGKPTPVDVEWALDGMSGQLFIVQARAETVCSRATNAILTEYRIKTNDLEPIVTGVSVGNKVSTGRVRILRSVTDDFSEGDVLVTEQTDPDWEPLMSKSSAIITNRGGRTCHAAIIARELGINAIVGTSRGTVILKPDQTVTVSCAEGEIGFVYDQIIPFDLVTTDLSLVPPIRTNLMLNIASPADVFKFHAYPVRGVGLVREEFIINNFIKIHPMVLFKDPNTLEFDLREKINLLTKSFSCPIEFYVKKLSYGLARIAATFYPSDVIVRFSDFKSNEYRNLLGGSEFEPLEENPMIGWRGASRYYDPKFEKAFGLECLAIKHLREELGLLNVIVMIPFCRTPEECRQVQTVMKSYGLERHVNDLQIYLMCEIPSNVILAEEFCKYVDGFSIGSNDLTQLTLGLDRDSNLVSHIYNERNPSVKHMIHKAIKTCKKTGTKIGICGQGPSDYPDFAQFLVEEGIDSISVTPDSVLQTIYAISKIEEQLK